MIKVTSIAIIMTSQTNTNFFRSLVSISNPCKFFADAFQFPASITRRSFYSSTSSHRLQGLNLKKNGRIYQQINYNLFPNFMIEAKCSSGIDTVHAKGFSTKFSNIGKVHNGQREVDIINSMLYRIRQCNNVPDSVKNTLLPFIVDGKLLGKVTKKTANKLVESSNKLPCSVFKISNQEISYDGDVIPLHLTLSEEAGDTCSLRTDSVMTVMSQLREEGVIDGWRDELLPLSEGFYDDPTLLVERAAAPFLGMMQYGVHINGIVREERDKNEDDSMTASSHFETKMWMARRSATKSKYPGMLDHIVAGGQPAGIGLMENVLKECMEEAGIPEDLTIAGIRSVGAISYEQYEPFKVHQSSHVNSREGDFGTIIDGLISRSVLFCYDLELPPDFEPAALDGEVESFFKWSVSEVMDSMKEDYHDPIKPNCYPVIIDYMLRSGDISPDSPGYLDILRELRGGYCG